MGKYAWSGGKATNKHTTELSLHWLTKSRDRRCDWLKPSEVLALNISECMYKYRFKYDNNNTVMLESVLSIQICLVK